MLPPNPKATKNVANHPIYWWKISLVKMLLAETFPLFPCHVVIVFSEKVCEFPRILKGIL